MLQQNVRLNKLANTSRHHNSKHSYINLQPSVSHKRTLKKIKQNADKNAIKQYVISMDYTTYSNSLNINEIGQKTKFSTGHL